MTNSTDRLVRRPHERTRLVAPPSGPSQTDTSFGNDTDVNRIVARFQRGEPMPTNNTPPQYGDVSHLQDDLAEIIAKGEKAKKDLKKLEIDAKEQAKQNKINDEKELKELRQQKAKLEQNQDSAKENPGGTAT